MNPVRTCDYTGIFARIARVFQSLLSRIQSCSLVQTKKTPPKQCNATAELMKCYRITEAEDS
jgi:hypothetical protein